MNPLQTVLIVDDDAPTRLVLRDLVTRAGNFAVIEADDGEAGLAAARRAAPDLILLDLMMPNLNGYEVCAALRADPRLREVPIFVLSAAEQNRATAAALQAGADDFLRKPCDPLELRAKIATSMRLNRYRALAEERERLRWLIDRSIEPLVVANRSGQLVFANARAREVFGLPPGGGFDVAGAVERHFRCEPADAWQQLRARNFQPGPDFAVFQPDNEYVAARWFNVELWANSGPGEELLLKFTDQTGQVRRELETWTFQRLIFHKIRTPLNGLGNVLDLVAETDGLRADENASSLLGIAQESARRLEASLLDILSYHEALFRPTQPPIDPTAGSLRDLVEAIAEELGLPAIALNGDELVPLAPETIALLRPILVEICENYAKFSSAPQTGLSLTLTPAGENAAELHCFAPGPIPPPEAIARLGRPYWQVQRTFTGEVPGMGLGLATARLLLQSHGGDLRCRPQENPTGLVTTLAFRPNVVASVEAAPNAVA